MLGIRGRQNGSPVLQLFGLNIRIIRRKGKVIFEIELNRKSLSESIFRCTDFVKIVISLILVAGHLPTFGLSILSLNSVAGIASQKRMLVNRRRLLTF